MFKSFKKLTGFKIPTDTEPTVKTLASEGGLRISATGAEKMGFKDGDYVEIIKDEESGTYGLLKTDGKTGSKLACANETGNGSLTLSAKPAWLDLGGNSETYSVYQIEDGVEAPASIIDVTADEDATIIVFPLSFVGKEDKPVRKPRKGEEESNSDENEADAPVKKGKKDKKDAVEA